MKQKKDIIIPLDMCKVTASNVVLYTDLYGHYHTRKKELFTPDHTIDSIYSVKNNLPAGNARMHKYELSKKAISRLKKSISYFCIMNGKTSISSRYASILHSSNISFLTLTLPAQQRHPDSVIVKLCLNDFFTRLRLNIKNLKYIWKAEAQSNGNIHFHVLLNRYVHHTILRKFWNAVLSKLGYIDFYRLKFVDMTFDNYLKYRSKYNTCSLSSARSAYDFGCSSDWSCPNSVDVHATRNIKNIPAYLSKYFSKPFTSKKCDPNFEGFSMSDFEVVKNSRSSSFCRLWYCSQVYLNVSEVPEIVGNALKSELVKLWEKFPKLFYAGEHFEVIKITPFMLLKHGFKRLFSIFENNLISYFSTVGSYAVG